MAEEADFTNFYTGIALANMNAHAKREARGKFNAYLDQYQNQTRFTLVGPMVEKHLRFPDPVIFVDGGSIVREGSSGFCVGDGDSSHTPMDLTLDPIKDFSDLSFALGLLPDNVVEITLAGFLGGRRDHELFNFGEVFHFLQKQETQKFVRMDSEVLAVTAGQWQFRLEGLFSLMAVEAARVEMQGACQYPIFPSQEVLPLSSFGLSNIAQGEISILTDNPIFLLAENIPEPTPLPDPFSSHD